MSLSSSELDRYSRQMLISDWGLEGQRKLKASSVAVAGIGGLGCPASLYLTAVGIGRIILIDSEKFELNNLNRQVLGWQRDIGRFKVEVAKEKLGALNPEVKFKVVTSAITEQSVRDVIGKVDVVVDGQDNWETRFAINAYCVENNIPFVHAGVSRFHGQTTTILPGEGPCLRCIFPKDPPENEEIPVLGATPALFASLQVMETIKIITGTGNPLVGRILFADGKEMEFETVDVKRNLGCPVCGKS